MPEIARPAAPDRMPIRIASLVLPLLLAARLLLGVAYSATNPLGEAPDEADHYAYAAYIGSTGTLPSDPSMTQAKHPPLYHVVAALAGAPAGHDATFLRSNPDAGFTEGAAPNFFIHTALESWPWSDGALAMHLARLVSVAAGLLLTAATWGLARRVWPGWASGAAAAAAFAAFLPESLFVGSSVSNDITAAALAASALWAAWPSGRTSRASRQTAALAGLLTGLAALTKVSAAAVGPAVALALMMPRADGEAARPRLVRAVIAGATALVPLIPWLLRNLALYGDLLGTPMILATVDRRTGPLTTGDLAALASGWFTGFWGKVGAAGHLPLSRWHYSVWAAVAFLAATGWLLLVLRRRRDPLWRGPAALGVLALWAAPLLVAASIVEYSRLALGTDQGRLLFPALAPLALLVAGGFASWAPDEWREGAGWLLAAVMLVAGTAGLFELRTIFAAPAPAQAAEAGPARAIGREFGGEMELVSVRWPVGSRDLTLFWRLPAPVAGDLRTHVRIIRADGQVVWEWKRSPGAGRLSTDRWQAGQVMADKYRIPSEAASCAARLELAVYRFPEGYLQPQGVPADTGPWLPLSTEGG